MDKVIKIGILFDFYGKLLTKKQYNVIESYYINDLSLGEISENIEVSRQGVFDLLKRAEAKLIQYEEELRLVSKFIFKEESIKEIVDTSKKTLKELDKLDKSDLKKELKKIINIGENLMNS